VWPTSLGLPWLLLTGFVASIVFLVPVSRRPVVIEPDPVPRRFEGARRIGGRVVHSMIPGLRDLVSGSLVRGWLTVGCLWVVLLTVMWLTEENAGAALGFASLYRYDFWGLFRNVPLPTPPSIDPEEAHLWTLLGAYPLYRTYWAVVIGCAVAAGGLHLRQVFELWRGKGLSKT
jgi:hypothetical protein